MTENQKQICKGIISSATYSSNYWAEVFCEKGKYVFKEIDEPNRQKTVTLDDVLEAAKLAASPKIKLCKEIKSECALLCFDNDNCDFDSESSDAVVQIAVLGDVVYG